MFQNLNLVCHNHRKQLGQGYTSYTMLRTGYKIFTMELRMYIILPIQNITYTFIIETQNR